MSTIYGNPILTPLFNPSAKIYGVDFTNMATTSKCTRTDAAANFADPQPAVAGVRPIHLECCQASAFK